MCFVHRGMPLGRGRRVEWLGDVAQVVGGLWSSAVDALAHVGSVGVVNGEAESRLGWHSPVHNRTFGASRAGEKYENDDRGDRANRAACCSEDVADEDFESSSGLPERSITSSCSAMGAAGAIDGDERAAGCDGSRQDSASAAYVGRSCPKLAGRRCHRGGAAAKRHGQQRRREWRARGCTRQQAESRLSASAASWYPKGSQPDRAAEQAALRRLAAKAEDGARARAAERSSCRAVETMMADETSEARARRRQRGQARMRLPSEEQASASEGARASLSPGPPEVEESRSVDESALAAVRWVQPSGNESSRGGGGGALSGLTDIQQGSGGSSNAVELGVCEANEQSEEDGLREAAARRLQRQWRTTRRAEGNSTSIEREWRGARARHLGSLVAHVSFLQYIF